MTHPHVEILNKVREIAERSKNETRKSLNTALEDCVIALSLLPPTGSGGRFYEKESLDEYIAQTDEIVEKMPSAAFALYTMRMLIRNFYIITSMMKGWSTFANSFCRYMKMDTIDGTFL